MNKKILALMVGVSLCGVLTSCDDDTPKGGVPEQGDAIKFSISNAQTRTEFDADNNLQINWIAGDKMRIYCQQATNSKKDADYQVGQSVDNSKHKWTLAPTSDNPLKWGEQANVHQFFAVYPAESNRVSVNPETGIATFKVNQNQECIVAKGADGHWTSTTNMNNAYMVATTSTYPTDKVELVFKPIMTTLDVVIKGREGANAGNVTVTGISIVNDVVDSPDAAKGQFQYNIKTGKIVNNHATNGATTSTEITFVNLMQVVDGTIIPHVDLEAGETITLTVFLPPLPIDAQNKVKVRVHATGNTEQVVTLGGANATAVNIPASSRAKVNLPFYPTVQKGNNWITPLDDDIYVSQLSIPGTHDAATMSCGLNSGKCQSKSINEQLNMGIRAFDLRPTCPSIQGGLWGLGSSCNVSTGENAKLPIYHGVANCNINLETVFTYFNTYLTNNPKEFIIVTLRWEEEGNGSVTGNGYEGTNKKWTTFAKAFEQFIANENNVPTSRRVKFKNDLTVGDMRGKILIIHRGCQGSNPDEFYTLTDTREAQDGVVFCTGWPAGGEDVRKTAFFKNKYQGNSIGSLYVQDYYNVQNTSSKINLIKECMSYSSQSHTNAAYKHIWFVNHCSGYSGSYGTATGQAYANNANAVNLPIYNYITDPSFVGSTGIVMLDFVGDRYETATGNEIQVNGDLLPQAIINNNYKYRMNRRGE